MSERIGTKRLPGTAEPVNPQFHDQFVRLCSIYFSGEITEEEWALLQIHMAFCDECNQRFLEYQQIASDVIPAMAAVAASERDNTPEESAASLDAAERRLMQELGSAPRETDRHVRRFAWQRWMLAVACVLAITALGTILIFGLRRYSPTQEARSVAPHEFLPQPVAKNPDATSQQAAKRSQEEIATLQQHLSAAEDHFKQTNSALVAVQRQLEAEQNAHKEIEADKESLGQQLAAAQGEVSSLRSRLETVGTDTSQQTLRMNDLESKVHELRTAIEEKDTALSEKDRMLALDKDFLSHDRDIRDLIGARNLYIADIFDTTENGRTAKQFGRLFYTKDRSLVFYGFDLDSQAARKQDVSFQVWGSGSDRPTPVSLGLLYEDDSHKRWVLRCNDAKSLARLDMVFVTVEPTGGSNKPTGKPMLRAYLQIHPNHP